MGKLKEISDLYINDFDFIKDFYSQHFKRIFQLSSHSLSQITNNLPDTLINEIKEYNQRIGADDYTLENISKLENKECLTIITGQQPGLFTGPLYTIYKGLTTIKLANHLSELYKRTIVPIFWVASEDHDFEEVNKIRWITKDNELKDFTFTPNDYQNGLPNYKISTNGNLNKWFDEIISTSYPTEYTDDILGILRNNLKYSLTIDEYFCRLLAKIFQGFGIVFLPSHLSNIRKLSLPIFQKEIENPLSSTRLIMKTANTLHNLGLKPTLKRKGNEINFFLIQNNIRRKVTYSSNRFEIEGTKQIFQKNELLKILNDSPDNFSPNVILRPIIQEHIFPNIAYIAGPGEISYFAQLKEVFKLFDVRFAIIYPRNRVVIVEPSLSQIFEKYNFELEKIIDSPKSLTKIMMKKNVPTKDLKVLELSKQKINGILNDVNKKVSIPSIEAHLKKMNEFVEKGFEKVSNSISNYYQSENNNFSRRMQKIETSLYPNKQPQERVLNIVQFLIKYGYDFMKELYETIDPQKQDLIIFDIKSILNKPKRKHP